MTIVTTPADALVRYLLHARNTHVKLSRFIHIVEPDGILGGSDGGRRERAAGHPERGPKQGPRPRQRPYPPPPTPFLPHSLTHSHSLTHARPRALPPIPLSQTTYTHPTPPSLRVFTRSIRRQRDRQTVVPSTWVNPVDGCRSSVYLSSYLLIRYTFSFFLLLLSSRYTTVEKQTAKVYSTSTVVPSFG
jgi:hypothetical protein